MKKPVLVILLMMMLLPAAADTLSYDSADQSLVYRGKFFSFSTSSGSVGGHFGPLKAGQISSDRHIHALIDSYSYLWAEHIRDDTESVKGLVLSFDEAGFFALYEPGLLTGFSLDIKGFEFALVLSGARKADDELFLSHNERHGFGALLIRTGYSSSWLHSSLKLSLRDETGIDIFASAGLSFKGLTVAFATGNEADVLGREADVHRAWYLTLDTDRLDFSMRLRYLNDPAKSSSYREIEAVCESSYTLLDKVKVSSRYESFYSEKGQWRCEEKLELEVYDVSVGWESGEGFFISWDAGPVSITVREKGYEVHYKVREDSYAFSIGLTGSGEISSRFSIHF